jgi:small subunit ribosomal protein S17e
MGRIKTRLMKRVSMKVYRNHGSQMSDDFEKNKILLSRFVSMPSKKMRNVVAGYLTRLRRAEQR